MTNLASNYLEELTRLFAATEIETSADKTLSLDEGAKVALDLIQRAKQRQGKVMVVGNGGSAAIASHTQNDLCKAVGIRSLVFTEQPLLTALSNDDGYEVAYEKMVKLWANGGDLLIAISSSGQSENILRSARIAREMECQVITMSGFAAINPLRRLGDVNFYVPSSSYGHVELVHAALGQFLTDALIGKVS